MILQHNLACARADATGPTTDFVAHCRTDRAHEYETPQKADRALSGSDDFRAQQVHSEEFTRGCREISRLYYEYYRFAVDTARKAERTMKRETDEPEVDAPTSEFQLLGWRPARLYR